MATVDPEVEGIGWYLLPLVLLSATLILMTSLMINNIQRRYPTFWWTPENVGKAVKEDDIEQVPTKTIRISDKSSSLAGAVMHVGFTTGDSIGIMSDDLTVPDGFYLAGEERCILEILQNRLRDRLAKPLKPSAQV